MKYAKEYAQVFGQANLSAPVKDGKKVAREGKTARDKAKGHIAHKKNRRIWVAGTSGRNGQGGAAGYWQKV